MELKNNFNSGIIGTGSYIPDNTLTNEDISKIVETSHEWIVSRTGIKERHIVSENQTTSDMALIASERAIENSGLEKKDIDLIIVATMSPDKYTPATASILQSKLGIKNIPSLDITAACSGFVYGLNISKGFIESGIYKNILLVGAEAMSRIVDWEDRSTCVLFGDGAGAVIISRVSSDEGILTVELGSDGDGEENLDIPVGGAKTPLDEKNILDRKHYLQMNGGEIFKFAVRKIPEISENILEKNGLKIEDIDYLIPHQANIRIIDSATKKLGIEKDKVIINLDKYGNMSAASIPVAIDESVRNGKIKKGNLLLALGFGAGLTWGATLIKW